MKVLKSKAKYDHNNMHIMEIHDQGKKIFEIKYRGFSVFAFLRDETPFEMIFKVTFFVPSDTTVIIKKCEFDEVDLHQPSI